MKLILSLGIDEVNELKLQDRNFSFEKRFFPRDFKGTIYVYQKQAYNVNGSKLHVSGEKKIVASFTDFTTHQTNFGTKITVEKQNITIFSKENYIPLSYFNLSSAPKKYKILL